MSDRLYIHLSELREQGCDVRLGAHPVSRDSRTGEPIFDLRDAVPTSGMGDRWLSREIEERKYRNQMYERGQMEDRHYRWDTHPSNVVGTLRHAFDHDLVEPRKSKKRKGETMSEKQILADSLLDNFNTINVALDDGGSTFTFKVPKDWEFEDPEEVDQFVVIPPGRGYKMRIAKVIDVHDKAYNPDEIKLKWCIQQVDTTEFDQYVDTDSKALETLREVEKRKAKRELLIEFAEGLDKKEIKQLETDLGVDLK